MGQALIRTNTTTRTSTRNQNLSSSSSSFDSSTTVDTISFDDISIRNEHISSSDETFMRSRNTEFLISNLKQARELTTSQSLLQGQIESFGSHIFKEGSVVVPGNISYDGQFYAVKHLQIMVVEH